MATKTELITRLEELLQQADPEQAADAVETVKEAYEALVAAQQDAANAESGEQASDEGGAGAGPAAGTQTVPIESATPLDEEDRRFKQLLDSFNQKVNDLHRKKAKEEADNLAAKHAVMEELRSLILQEENIGNAFQRFNELRETWKTIGPIPHQSYRELQHEYSQLLDEFFYHIRIYKELRDHDLRKNTALKQALISDMEALVGKDNIKELESMVKDYQEKWHQVGPVVKEEWEALRDGFWNATRGVYEKIHEHYRARRAEHEANLEAKQVLVDKLKEQLSDIEKATAKEWRELTDKVLELQGAWKNIGFATKKENERIWKEFREECNGFFEKKRAYFESLKDQYKEARERKEALLAEAIALNESTDWRQTADKLKALQARWKEVGTAGPRDEHKLWNKFREACDAFFKARKDAFAQQDAERSGNTKAREELIAEIKAFVHSGNRNEDLDTLKSFSKRWMESGRVSPRQYDALVEEYRKALDGHYETLKLEGEERRKMQYQGHLEELRTAPDAKDRLDREQRVVRRKIDEMETEMRQMEQNMGMFNFKSASGEAMRKEMDKKVDRIKREVDRLKDQHKQLLKELR